MKKVLVLLFICLTSTMMFGQTQTPWGPVNSEGVSGVGMTVTGLFYIDGVEQKNGQVEIGVFTTDEGLIRASQMPIYRATKDQWLYMITIYGIDGETYTFKAWDHETDQELPLVCDLSVNTAYPTVVTYADNAKYGKNSNPYMLNFTSATSTIPLEISGWDQYTGELNGGYHLIATPVDGVKPTEVLNMVDATAENYDLYTFDQNEDEEWRNYKADADQDNYTLNKGMGYLYAHNETVTLQFPGTAMTEDYTVILSKGTDNGWEGWNLVGNSFTEPVNINLPFCRMNEAGDGYENAEGQVNPMEAVFVVAENDEEELLFSLDAKKAVRPGLAVNLRSGNRMVDNAIVHFDQGRQLPKMQFRQGSTKVYIPMNDKDYAVVSTESMGELPVNFKAEKSGSYTLSFNAQEVSFAYLHLIDNMTGNDVDLLATPSYSFEASTTDYESRFKLVFATGNADDTFAFFSNGSFVINNEGDATLQVMDVTGRMISSETINGCANVNVNAAPGVYMLRLINGDNVKVQKVVVK